MTRPDVLDGLVEVVDGPLDALGHLGAGRQPDRPLEGQAGGEQPLDHRVVEVPGDPLPVFEEGQFPQAAVEPGVLDGHAGRSGQGDDQFFVDVAEHLGRLLVGEVEVPEHLVPHQDGDAQEGVHRRVVGREPEAVGMLGQVGEPQRLGLDDEQAEDAVALGQIADGGVGLAVEADGDEVREPGAGLVEDPESPEPGVDQFHGGGDDPLQHRPEIEVRADGEHGIDQAAEGTGTRVL
jgi:hypothetical protein